MRTPLTLFVASVLALAACGDDEPVSVPPPDSTAAAPTIPPTSIASPDEKPLAAVGGSMYEAGAILVAALVGQAVPDFERDIAELGFGPVRVAWQDGEYLGLTDDLMVGRANIAVDSSSGTPIVIDAFVENDPETGTATPEATIVEVYDGVNYYPACGNEQLTHEGVTWYQVQKNEYPEVYERAANGYRENPPESVAVRGFAPRVVAPGPGDDVGTLVVWTDGVAYFVSDSGDLTAWLVDEELTYPWEC